MSIVLKLIEPLQFGHFYPEFWFIPALLLATLWKKYQETDPVLRPVNELHLFAEYDFVVGEY